MKYSEEEKTKNTLQLRKALKELPEFMTEFYRGINDTTSYLTKQSYAYDFKIFFDFMAELKKKSDLKDFTIDDLKNITAEDIELFMEHITYYEKEKDGVKITHKNEERAKSRKLSAIRTLFAYFYKKRKIPSNPAELVDLPKIHQKAIVKLEVDEVSKLLDEVEEGKSLSKRQQKFHDITGVRDLAIVTLLLGTGIRVSECVGIDIDDIDFDINGIKITRKGGNEAIIYFGEEVCEALKAYLAERTKSFPKEGHENALFLSLHKKRITPRTIQKLVKKYASSAAPLKKISPHKLRSTYGTNLYRETGDIYLVADVLGHRDVNTTRKHYANMDDDRRRSAANIVKLRKE